ncbi:DUF4339 domain-containing protein [Rubripirellula reticaptiva]|uniref:GYF domain-containing protein n=1 Tax=Rubripirellula reticaptiva TaxID=2528013 RepID=A0A5C6EMG8_9BACT|nr:DUF4339 domain-containing protein [Rubripirellula reticaptiva]TWU49590.1 hypothetical protein Poly59_42070 [Rubripirellula reticaptiva]
MGVRFACHVCGKQLNIKQELAGRRGICPKCQAKFRIPREDAPFSIAIEDSPPDPALRSTIASNTDGSKSGQSGVKIDLIANDPDATWYVRPPSGGQYGPASGELLKQWIAEGRVASTALIWRDGWPQWRSADEALAEIASTLPRAAQDSGGPASVNPSNPSVASPSVAGAGVAAGGIKAETPNLAGQSSIGAERRSRNLKRIFWVGVLSLVAIVLAAVLVFLINRSAS